METDRSSRPVWRRRRLRWSTAVGLAVLLAAGSTSVAIGLSNRFPDANDRALIARNHPTDLTHTLQGDLNNISNTRVNGQPSARFTKAFNAGDALFSHQFTAAEGGGAQVGTGQRYTRVPRADLTGAGQWATHTPSRATGPNAASCDGCHNQGAEDGSGSIAANAVRDPTHSGSLNKFIERQTPHLLGLAGIQLAAEEITDDLQADRDAARNAACVNGGTQTKTLDSKGINFGSISATRTGVNPCTVTFNTSGVRGVSADLVVRPFQWKGTVGFVRDFVRGAMHNENGVQGVEMAGDNVDGDGDGVTNELFVGDVTVLAVYMAAQARPTHLQELAGITNPASGQPFVTLTAAQNTSINNGRTTFNSICASCHVPAVTLNGRTFSEPSQNPDFRDTKFPAGQDPGQRGVTPSNSVLFDITRDQPDNRVVVPNTNGDLLGSFRRSGNGAQVAAFTDYKRHDLGFEVAEQIDEEGTGASTFMTRALWGVGSTGPYLHDGRATTLTEAILYHGGEAANSRQAFLNLTASQQADLINYLNEHVLFRTD